MQATKERAGDRPAPDFRLLYRKLERTLGSIERSDSNAQMLECIVMTLVQEFREDLGFGMGRIYQREGDEFVLCCTHGGSHQIPIGYRMPPDYPPHRRTLEEGLIIMRKGEPGFDEEIERAIGVDSTFAAIAVGPGNTHVMAFSVDGEIHEEQILYSLAAVRHVVNLKLEQRKLTGMIEEARIIQESLLPSSPPRFDGYDIHGLSRPAEIVGGDLFDYLPLSDRLLGVAIADATGHGLPAALLARDVITALRVTTDEHLKVVHVVEKLNRVIHRAALSSKFISLFYGELEPNGTLVYCNAGHNPPLLLRDQSFEELDRGGLILGPNPAARYEKGHTHLATGDLLILYTDGLIECEDSGGEAFGTTRLQETVRGLQGAGAREVAEGVLAAADRHAGGESQKDDITLVVIRKI